MQPASIPAPQAYETRSLGTFEFTGEKKQDTRSVVREGGMSVETTLATQSSRDPRGTIIIITNGLLFGVPPRRDTRDISYSYNRPYSIVTVHFLSVVEGRRRNGKKKEKKRQKRTKVLLGSERSDVDNLVLITRLLHWHR
jgi:hypothetical protein